MEIFGAVKAGGGGDGIRAAHVTGPINGIEWEPTKLETLGSQTTEGSMPADVLW